MTDPTQPHDRRRFPRAGAEIACKVRRDARAVFAPGRTTNLSCGGAAIELASLRQAVVGERIAVAFEDPARPIARSEHMVTATVVRVDPAPQGLQRIALAFDAPQAGLTDHARRAA